MNRSLVLAAIGLFTLTGAALAATDAPSRKPGYWELTTVAPMIGKKTTNVALPRRTTSSRRRTAVSARRRR